MDQDTPEDISSSRTLNLKAETSRKHIDQINEFSKENGLNQEYFNNDRFKALHLSDPDVRPLDDVRRNLILEARAKVKAAFAECDVVSVFLASKGYADGVLESESGTQNLVGFGSHFLTWVDLGSEGVLAVDYTARDDIDKGQGNFDILCVSAPNMDQLLTRLNNLYGGKWKTPSEEKVAEIKKHRIPWSPSIDRRG